MTLAIIVLVAGIGTWILFVIFDDKLFPQKPNLTNNSNEDLRDKFKSFLDNV